MAGGICRQPVGRPTFMSTRSVPGFLCPIGFYTKLLSQRNIIFGRPASLPHAETDLRSSPELNQYPMVGNLELGVPTRELPGNAVAWHNAGRFPASAQFFRTSMARGATTNDESLELVGIPFRILEGNPAMEGLSEFPLPPGEG